MQIRNIIAVLVLSVGAYAQGGFYKDQAVGRLINGNTLIAIPGAAISVCSDSQCASPITVYSDAPLTQAISPLVADSNGNFSFYAHPGQYFCQVAATGFAPAINPCQVSPIPPNVANVDLTGQVAAISTTTLYAVPVNGSGSTEYRLSWNAKVTTAAGVSSTLGALTITYTDPDGVVQTITTGAQTSAGAIATTSTGNSTTTVLLGLPMLLNCKPSTTIQYAFAYVSNAASAMSYNLHLRLEAE